MGIYFMDDVDEKQIDNILTKHEFSRKSFEYADIWDNSVILDGEYNLSELKCITEILEFVIKEQNK